MAPAHLTPKGFSFEVDPAKKLPVGILLPTEFETVVGAIVKLDGSNSFDPNGNPLTYTPRFVTKPIGSQVVRFGFTQLEEDGSIVSFAPDVSGHYRIGLVVNNGNLDSLEVFSEIDVKVILVPHNKGITPDASFIWNFLSDFWSLLEGRRMFETFWSAAIQIVAAELLKLYQIDYNKSIKDIQELFQRRWLSYTPTLTLDPDTTSFILADDQAGLNASTLLLDPKAGVAAVNQPDYSTLVSVPKTEGSFVRTSYGQVITAGRVLKVAKRSFTLARSGELTDAVNYGIEGHSFAPSGGASDFFGSGFLPAHLGLTLRILSGPEQGDYLITAVTSSAVIRVQTLAGGSPLLTEHTNLIYTVMPAQTTRSAFFADRSQVPTQLDGQPWRFSSTLVSSEFDFEAQGVFPGDVLEVELTRLDNLLATVLKLQVVSVDRNRLGFVLNLSDLVEGRPVRSIDGDTQLALADALRVQGLFLTQDAALFYSDEAATVLSTVSSISFKRANYEKPLSAADTIDVGAFSIRAKPMRIRRNSALPVDPKVVSVPALQEYIKTPMIATVGKSLLSITEDGSFPIDHTPPILFENLDYIIDDESTITGTCNTTAGSINIVVPFGDLLDRNVSEGDSLEVTAGASTELFTVLKVVDAETLRVFPTPSFDFTTVFFKLTRRVAGKFVRFVPGVFTKTSPAPDRLWAEVTFFDNNDAVGANFGVLVGVTPEDLKRQDAVTPYRSSVAGLMFVLAGGPKVSNLHLAAQILFGLPFAQNAGVIVEINPDYRLRDDGSRLLGRILVQAYDKRGKPLGVTNIYFYPHGRQLPDPNNVGQFISATPDFAGLGINLDTGLEFRVGDVVKQFTPLSKGASIQEYLSSPDWFERFISQGDAGAELRKYHSFQLLANADIVSSGDVDLAAQFLRGAKPHYTKMEVGLLRSIEDFVIITDDIEFSFGSPPTFADIPGFSLPRAVNAAQGIGPLDYIADGKMYSWYYSGTDLRTILDDGSVSTTLVTSATGGFVDAIVGTGQSHDAPFIQAGDQLHILNGVNVGIYDVVSVPDDITLELQMVVAGDRRFFEERINQSFRVFRSIQNPIFVSDITVTNTSTDVTVGTPVGSALFSSGAAVDDILVFYDPSNPAAGVSRRYRIAVIDLVTGHYTLDKNVVEATGSYKGYVIREDLLTKYLLHPATDIIQSVTFVLGDPYLVFDPSGDLVQLGLLRPGDLIVAVGSFDEGIKQYTVVEWKPATLTALVKPTPDFSTALEFVKVSRPGASETPIYADIQDRAVHRDYLNLLLYRRNGGDPLTYDVDISGSPADPGAGFEAGPDLTTTNGSDTVSTVSGENFATMKVIPGDYLAVRSGADSTRDTGHGPGIFVIIAVPTTTTLQLAETLTETNGSPGLVYGILRKRPNEG